MSEQHSFELQPNEQGGPAVKQAIEVVAQMQGELDTLRDQLAWSNRLGQLGVLNAALCHEMNNLLTPISSYAQLALANPDDSMLIERALQAAVAGTKKITQLTDRVMSLASPNEVIQTGACRLDEVVTSIATSMMPMLKQQGVHLLTKVQPHSICVDALAIEQVFINLVCNACQAMGSIEGRRQVLIATPNPCPEDQPEPTVIIEVSDTGPGIPDEIRDQLFEPFVTSKSGKQPHNAMAGHPTQPAGSGLGLSICKQLVESFGGTISLGECSEDGSTFQIELPLADNP